MFSAITWSVSPTIVDIGSLAIRWYGLLFAFGFILAYQLMSNFFKNEAKPIKSLEALTYAMIIGTVAGARLGHCLFYEPSYYLANPIEILKIWNGGLASHGAAVGILLAIFWFSRKYKSNFTFMWVVDRIVITVPLAGAMIRFGNFFNSEIIGYPTDKPWAVIFTSVDMLPRHPSQLYEAFSYLIIFGILLGLYQKFKRQPNPGFIFGVFLILLFGARFLIEYTKEVQSAFETSMIMHMGQLLSLPFIIAGIAFVVYSFRKAKKV